MTHPHRRSNLIVGTYQLISDSVVGQFDSPFLAVPLNEWICSNELALAIFDGFPVSLGHALVTTRRIVATWFDATEEEQAALMALVKEVKGILDESLDPKPDGYNVGFNSGEAAGQTVPHVHIHVIPRYHGDMPDPRGGVRHVIPDKGNYLSDHASRGSGHSPYALSTGAPGSPLWTRIAERVSSAERVDLLASFVQPSGLDLIQSSVFAAIRGGASIRILVGDYLYISSTEALKRLLGWMDLAADIPDSGELSVRLAEISRLNGAPESFHPKAWRIRDSSGGFNVVGSSNLSRAALETGVEWNLIGRTSGSDSIDKELEDAFDALWAQSTALDDELVGDYGRKAAEARRKFIPPESVDTPAELHPPRPWQEAALTALARIRAEGHRRALVAVATGLGKTWLAAFDVRAAGRTLDRRPRVLLLAHRAEILAQAEATIRRALESEWGDTKVSWYLGSRDAMDGDLVVASVQKLSRPVGLLELEGQTFDYAIIDEVHHAHAPTYRRVLARMHATFTLGLTATPERTDGVDVASLFDDVLAWQATIGDGIEEGSLVPFHYVGLKDDVDFQQIPWRNGRFDTTALEEKLENSSRMEQLWKAWQIDPTARTLVFCTSRRHALFSRDWLRRKGVRAAAVISGTGGDPRGDSLAEFVSGTLQTLCVVDLFNEGLDVPAVDRVIMLRPTESKVIFLQQLGRGLRASGDKSRLKVIDFVGNHRVFANRIKHLLSLGSQTANWATVGRFLKKGIADLPDGCLVDLDTEAKELMLRFVPQGGNAVVEAYRAMRDELGRRPLPTELFHQGYLPRTLAGRFGSWFGFLETEDDLNPSEQEASKAWASWFTMLEVTSLNKSYKMVVLRVLLDLDALWDGLEIEKLAAACREFILSHPILCHDLPPTQRFPDPANAPIDEWAQWWLEWPLSRWMDDQGGRQWFKREGERFVAAFSCADEQKPTFEAMTAELVDYRLALYAKNRIKTTTPSEATSFRAKVSHSGGRPILWVPTVEENPSRPMGPTKVRLPDDGFVTFKFVKVACNVANREGSTTNDLPGILRGWFGPDAGLPGTGFQVAFDFKDGEWAIRPVAADNQVGTPFTQVPDDEPDVQELPGFHAAPPMTDRFTRLVPVFTLEAAAGLWGPESTPEEIGWIEAPEVSIKPGMFVAKVVGHSMEPKIRDGQWCLFRPCPAGSREGRIVLVQFNAEGDSDHARRFTVKRYHSVKLESEDGWSHESIEFRPINPDYPPIEIAPQEAAEMLIVGEFVRGL